MRYSFAAAALAATAYAAPVEDIMGRSTFKVPAVRQNTTAHPVLAMAKTYRKYNAQAPADVKAAAAAQSGSVAAYSNEGDVSYLCPVNVGGKTLNLDFDTGSSDLWVFSTYLPASQQSGHDIYSPGSTASRLSGQTWKISYGDGSGASGIVFADKVVVGPVTATKQAVEAATSISAQFAQDSNNDGLLGLAFSSINTVSPTQQKTFFDSVKSTLAQPLFAADLQAGQTGSYDFGYIDSSAYYGSITYTSVDNSQGFWGFTAGGYSTGSAGTSGSIGSAIMDTGTTLLYIPSAAVRSYYNSVPGGYYDSNQGGYLGNCNANWPQWNVRIGSTTFSVPGSYINFQPLNDGSGLCFGGIQSSSGLGINIFGDIFIKSKYVIFDQTQGSPRLGVANK